jgi:hypothetical protein
MSPLFLLRSLTNSCCNQNCEIGRTISSRKVLVRRFSYSSDSRYEKKKTTKQVEKEGSFCSLFGFFFYPLITTTTFLWFLASVYGGNSIAKINPRHKELVVLLHAVGGGPSSWTKQIESLEKNYSVLALDLKRSAEEATVANFARDVAQAIEKTGYGYTPLF